MRYKGYRLSTVSCNKLFPYRTSIISLSENVLGVYKNVLIYNYTLLCSRKTVVNLAVAEGPAVQGIYQQVIREFPDLIGGAGPLWGSKNRRLVYKEKHFVRFSARINFLVIIAIMKSNYNDIFKISS